MQYILIRRPDGSDRCAFASNLPGAASSIAYRLAREFEEECLLVDGESCKVLAAYKKDRIDYDYLEASRLAEQRKAALQAGHKIIRYH